jgi:diguanylate cyclase (GGDEF)-like protein
MMPDKILVLDEQAEIRCLVAKLLSDAGYSVWTAANRVDGLRIIRGEALDLVIADIRQALAGDPGLLDDVKASQPDVEVILLAPRQSLTEAIQVLDQGVYDFVLKPVQEHRVLLARVQHALRVRHLRLQNRRLLRELEEAVIKDPLTGLYNQRRMQQCILDEIVRSTRYNHHFLLILAGVDHFQSISDTHGPLYGDFILTRLARLLEDNLRLTDTTFCHGRGQFMLLLPETRKIQAVRVADRILESIRYHDFSCHGDRAHVTLSLGAAEFPFEARDSAALIGLAGQRLAQARDAGCDCFLFENRDA